MLCMQCDVFVMGFCAVEYISKISMGFKINIKRLPNINVYFNQLLIRNAKVKRLNQFSVIKSKNKFTFTCTFKIKKAV